MIITLSLTDLVIAACMIVTLSILSILLKLNMAGKLLIAASRTILQLSLIGFVLKFIFASSNPFWIALMAVVMLLGASREVVHRQHKTFKGFVKYGLGSFTMFLSSFSITMFSLIFIIQNDPWYMPQYAIPILGMMLGNSMNGIALGMDRLTSTAWQQSAVIENRLALGEDWNCAISDIRKQAIKTGMIPMINSMSVAGLVSLPGMMTGQILAGNSPESAVKYQILIMFMITTGTGLGTMASVWFSSRLLFDKRQRLCLNRLKDQ